MSDTEQSVVIATWSPCCHSLREGENKPGSMHSGLCSNMHHGEPWMGALGPTVRLVVHPDDLPLLDSYVESPRTFTLGALNADRVMVEGCHCYECEADRGERYAWWQ